MGLAPYGEPAFRDLILSELLDLKDDGSFRLNLRYFDFMEPPVCTPEEAFRCFMRTEMDYLVLGNFLLDKTQQDPANVVKGESVDVLD